MSNVIPLESPPPFMSPHMYFLPPPPPVFIGGIPLLDDLLTDFHGDSRDSAKAGGKKKGCTTPSGEGLLHEEGTANGHNNYLRDPRIDGNQPKMCKGNSDAIKGRSDDATDFHGDSRDSAKAGGKKKGCTTPSGEGLLHKEGTANDHNDSMRNPGIDGNRPKTCKGNSDDIVNICSNSNTSFCLCSI